jgi:hypothetical protein
MQLSQSVTITIGPEELIFERFDVVIIDDAARKIVLARLHPAFRPLMLWRGDSYDEIGDWTQAQAEAKILELLGENQQETLQSFVVA